MDRRTPRNPLDHSHDAVLAREIAIEQRHVDRVYDRLGDAHRSAEQVAAQGKTLFERDRADFVREEDGTGLFERDVFAFQSARRLATLNAEHEGLVFGRLDLLAEEIRYIGRIGVRDEDYEPLVIDWRARAAEPFYRATSAEPMEVIRRRVLRSRSDRVIGIEDDLIDGENAPEDMVVIGEGALMAALSRARGPRMRDIVATIQAEQDEAIRAPYHGFTIIAGGPGTGKTVVALHRAAYLLYSNRRRFENGGVLVVGPSRVFMNYIERVLPSLGEDSVTLRALGSVASDVFGFRTERIDSAEAHAIKGSLRMLPLLRRLINEPVPTGDPPSAGEATELRLRLTVKGEVFTIGAAQLERIRTEVLRHQKVNQARPSAEAALLTALWQKKPADLDLERAEFEEYVTESQAWQDFLPQWWPSLRATRVLRRLADPELVRRVARRSALPRTDPDPGRFVRRTHRLVDRRFRTAGRTGVPAGPGHRGDRDRGSAVPGRRHRRHRGGDHDGAGAGPGHRAGGVRRRLPHLRPRPGRRGAGRHADGLADVAPPRRPGLLDRGRRSGPEFLARCRRDRPGDDRSGRQGTGTPVPDEHQLPVPRRRCSTWRPRWSSRRTRTPTCPPRSARPGSNRPC